MSRRLIIAAVAAATFGVVAACGSNDTASSKGGSDGSGSTSSTDWAAQIASTKKGTSSEPPTTGPAPKKGVKVIYISCGEVSPGCADPGKGGREAAELLGWSYDQIDGKFNVANGYTVAIRQAIVQKPDAIWTAGIDCDRFKVGLQEAKKAGIPVLGTVNEDCDESSPGDASLFPIKMKYNDGADTANDFYAQLARMKADYIIAKTEGKLKLLNIGFSEGLTSYMEAFVDQVEACGSCEIVDDLRFTPAEASNPKGPIVGNFKSSMLKHPEVNALATPFDGQLLNSGLLQAIKNTPSGDELVVLGGEGTKAGMEALSAGPVPTAEAPYSTAWLGWAAIDSINRYLNGEEPVSQGFGARILEKADAAGASTYESDVDFRAAYKEAWGVN